MVRRRFSMILRQAIFLSEYIYSCTCIRWKKNRNFVSKYHNHVAYIITIRLKNTDEFFQKIPILKMYFSESTPRKMFCWINKNFHWPICLWNFVRPTKFLLIQQNFGWPNKVFRLNMGQWKFLLIQQNFCWFNKTFFWVYE